MPAIADRMRQYATALSDPTRGMILMELDRAGELTPTQLARRLGLTPNNVYHHMRVLAQLGVVDPPRAVPGDTYVEKYYQINPETRAAARLDREWYRTARDTITVEDHQAILVSMCLVMANHLRQAARELQNMPPEQVDDYLRNQQVIMLSINRLSRDELKSRMRAIADVLFEADRRYAEDTEPRTDLMLIAALPSEGDRGGE